jgi:dephospho-CoA kinase
MKVIGLTGGIGVGKSTVLAVLHDLGARVIEADEVGHQIYRRGTEGWRRVVERFGKGILSADREIDRRHLGETVFADPKALADLNAAVHPLMHEEIRTRLKALEDHGPAAVVIDAALLLEAGWDDLVSEVWVVTASPEQASDRLQHQRGLSDAQVRQRMDAQASQEWKLQQADVVIENNGNLDSLRQRVRFVWQKRTSGVSE